jgi:mono/diheme cytochrome c family protein
MRKLTTICALFVWAASMFGQSAARKDAAMTAVTGESWLHHLNRSFDETSMGKTSRLGPATDESAPRLQRSMSALSDSTTYRTRMETLRGSDLYRLNCQGCHGEHGLGAPPEIASLIDPVRATSVVLVTQRMKKTGMEMSSRETAQLVNQSRSALLKRLHQGGTDMPSFHHLNAAEIRSLVAYLKQLAGVPGAEKEQIAIQESDARIGELIVKSTCHTCHDATGTNPTSEELMQGAIPPLSALPTRVNRAQLVRKVTSGAAVIMGTTSSVYRGRMPVFDYLSEREAADVYEYLTQYPTAESARVDYSPQPTQLDPADPPTSPSRMPASAPPPESHPTSQAAPTHVPISREPAERQAEFVFLPMTAGLFAVALITLGCWITLHEFRRPSVEQRTRAASRRPGVDTALWVALPPRAKLLAGSPNMYAEATEGEPSDWMDERRIS